MQKYNTKNLPLEKIMKIIELRYQRKKIDEIEFMTGISKHIITKILKKNGLPTKSVKTIPMKKPIEAPDMKNYIDDITFSPNGEDNGKMEHT